MKRDKIQLIHRIIGILGVILILGTLGCSGESKRNSSALGTSLKIGVMPDTGATPFIIAKEMGFFENIDVDITLFRNAQNRDAALATGELHGASTDVLAAIFYEDGGLSMQITSYTESDYRMVSSPKKNAEELKGAKAVAGISKDTVIDFTTSLIGKIYNMDIVPVILPQIPVRLEMLRNGELDVATLPEPLATAAIVSGGESIASTIELGLYPGVMVFSKKFIQNNPEAIEAFYDGYNRAVEYINSTPQSEYYDIVAKALDFPDSVAPVMVFPEFSPASLPEDKDFDPVMEWAIEQGLTRSQYSVTDLIYEK